MLQAGVLKGERAQKCSLGGMNSTIQLKCTLDVCFMLTRYSISSEARQVVRIGWVRGSVGTGGRKGDCAHGCYCLERCSVAVAVSTGGFSFPLMGVVAARGGRRAGASKKGCDTEPRNALPPASRLPFCQAQLHAEV